MTILNALSARLRRSRFLRRLSILSGGMVFGQGLLIVSTPLLTRLYTPEDFGLFVIFSALASIFAMMIGLRYEIAIPLERNDQAAAALVAGTALTSACISLFLCLLILSWGPSFAQLIGTPQLSPLLWLLPPCLLLWGGGSALSLWSIRQGTFRLNGVNRIVQYGAQAGGQLAFGPTGIGAPGLIFGYALGYLLRFLHLLLALPKTEIRAFFQPSLIEIWSIMRRYWRYPAFSASSSVLQTASNMLPAILIAILYGPAMAGLYGLGQRVVALPLRLLGESASQVFLGEIRNVDHNSLIRLFKQTASLFAGLGIICILPLILIGPWLFSLVFGESWRDAGIIVQLLAPLYLTRFVVTPVSQTLNALQRQDLHLAASALAALALFASFTIGWWLTLEPYWTIAVFSATSTLAFIFYIVAAWRNLHRADWQKLHRAD